MRAVRQTGSRQLSIAVGDGRGDSELTVAHKRGEKQILGAAAGLQLAKEISRGCTPEEKRPAVTDF